MWMYNRKMEPVPHILPDDGFFFGRGVFETLAVFTDPVFLESHVSRLNRGLQALGVARQLELEWLRTTIRTLGIRQCVLKVVVTPDNVILTRRELPENPVGTLASIRVRMARQRRNADSLIVHHKTLNYAENLLELDAARKQGYAEAIYLNGRGALAESCTGNLFWVTDGVVRTPSVSCGVLPGVFREWLLQKFPVEEGEFMADELRSADEVFLTNSVHGVRPILDIHGLGSYTSMSVSSQVADAYHAMLVREGVL